MPPPAEALASRILIGPALRTQPDRRLVSLVRQGYELAFEEIVRRYRAQLGRYAAGIVGSRSEDVTQDAFSKALLALRRDQAEIELRPWLYRIVRNTALNELRDRPPAAGLPADEIAAGATTAELIEQREELRDLIGRLQALPERQRAAVVMRELEGLGHDEIATALGLSGGAARQAIYRARQALRDGLGLLVPLPLVRALLDHTPGTAEAAAGAAGIGGAGMAMKATTVLVVGAVGAGIAIKGPLPAGDNGLSAAGPERASARPAPQGARSIGLRRDASTLRGVGNGKQGRGAAGSLALGTDSAGRSHGAAGNHGGRDQGGGPHGAGPGNGPRQAGGGDSTHGGDGGESRHGGDGGGLHLDGSGDGTSGESEGGGHELQSGSGSDVGGGDGSVSDSGSSVSDSVSSGSDHEEVTSGDPVHEESSDRGSLELEETSSSSVDSLAG